MHKYKVFLKDGTSAYAECPWTSFSTIESLLENNNHFIRIGEKAFAKDFIASIIKIETTED